MVLWKLEIHQKENEILSFYTDKCLIKNGLIRPDTTELIEEKMVLDLAEISHRRHQKQRQQKQK